MLFGGALVGALAFTEEIPAMEPVWNTDNPEEPLIALVPAEGSLVVESAPESMPACSTDELASFCVCSVVEALIGGGVAVTVPAATATAKGVYILSARYVATKGLRVPSVVVQTALVVPESTQSPE